MKFVAKLEMIFWYLARGH